MRGAIILLVLIGGVSRAGAQSGAGDQSWTTSNQQVDPSGTANPTRTTTTHSEVDGRIVEKTVVEARGPDGRYVPYSETERESVRVNDSTTRKVERSYARDPDGRRVLTQEMKEESRSSADGGKKITRTTSNPDGNGALQVVQRALIDSKQVSPDMRETKTTLFAADGSGGLAPTMQIAERERKTDASTVESTKSTSLADGAGHWTMSEVRQATLRQDGAGTTKEERVLRPDSNGKMAMVERTVSKESAGGAGTTETYSTNVPGQAGDEGLRLVRRESTAQRAGTGGERQMTRRIEQSNPGDPAGGVQVTQQAIDIVRPGSNGVAQQQSTIVTTDANGRMNAVWVDMGKSDKPAVKTDAVPAKKSK